MRLVRRLLARCVALVVLLPIALLVILGLGALLNGLGDRTGAMVCARLALCGGAAWLVVVIAMALVTAVAVVGTRPHGPPPWEPMRREGGLRGGVPHRRRSRRRGERHGRPPSADESTGDAADG